MWLQRTCGLGFQQDLVVTEGSVYFSTAMHGVANFASGTVQIPHGSAAIALGALKGNHFLRSVPGKPGVEAFESHPGATENRTCWLNSEKETVFFEYRD